MRQTLRKRMVVAAATTGLLSLYGTPVFADTGAHGAASNSPGVASGNAVEVPVTIPVNICGNTVDAAAVGNPTIGNECGNTGDHAPESPQSPQSPRSAPERHTTPVAEPQYSAAPATDPEDSWEQAYEEYTRPDAYERQDEYAEYTNQRDAGGHENHDDPQGGYDDSPSDDRDVPDADEDTYGGYGDAPDADEHTYGGYGDVPDADEDTGGGYGDTPDDGGGYGDTPPTEPQQPPTDKPPTDKPPTDKPPTDKPPTDKPPTDHPPTDQPPTLPETGSDREVLLGAGAASFALIAGGGILYRRGRAASGR
ncbi:chaplin family protein [Streptomyces europaeiscabiei]|uniref:chaplin n=1 Tax=Streptomyces europaeiscabiei TaxID=146819 RepID=UPI0029ACCA73|nr:chaplin family protein [Streptomyces europaeiscabiei]MDX3697709.1 chaplin family protein [Streptomyces europaeiscabiei]